MALMGCEPGSAGITNLCDNFDGFVTNWQRGALKFGHLQPQARERFEKGRAGEQSDCKEGLIERMILQVGNSA